jgi:hypothetical protein
MRTNLYRYRNHIILVSALIAIYCMIKAVNPGKARKPLASAMQQPLPHPGGH